MRCEHEGNSQGLTQTDWAAIARADLSSDYLKIWNKLKTLAAAKVTRHLSFYYSPSAWPDASVGQQFEL